MKVVTRAALLSVTLIVTLAVSSSAQTAAAPTTPARADVLRGEYGRYRANNDLLEYRLDIRVDPESKTISGKNTIRFRMLSDDTSTSELGIATLSDIRSTSSRY